MSWECQVTKYSHSHISPSISWNATKFTVYSPKVGSDVPSIFKNFSQFCQKGASLSLRNMFCEHGLWFICPKCWKEFGRCSSRTFSFVYTVWSTQCSCCFTMLMETVYHRTLLWDENLQSQDETSEEPNSIGSMKVLTALGNFLRTCSVLVGLTYVLELAYPKEVRYTCEVFQKLLLELDYSRLSPNVNNLKNKLWA